MPRVSRPLIAPSLLAADFANLGAEVSAVAASGADMIHLDVMDGHFVPNLTFGPVVMRALRPLTALPFDVHLMMTGVDAHLESFRASGADLITIHPEAGPHPYRTLQRIRALGAKPGLALNPGTPVAALEPVLDEVDLVLVMSVNPGFGGQAFLPSQLKKIEAVRELIDRSGREVLLEVDGGINAETAAPVLRAGADALVAGTAVFAGGASAYTDNIARLRSG